MNKNKKKKSALVRWFIARLLCLTHLAISIFLLLATKFGRRAFFVPIIGVGVIILEIIVFSLLKFRIQYSFLLLFTYSVFTIASIWLLELFRINHLITIQEQQAAVEVFSVVYYAPIPSDNQFFLYNKYLWSQIQIQGYVFIIVILKGLCEKRDHRLDTLVKTWATALDILDFIDLLSYQKLYSNSRFVHLTLSIWSISCLQFTFQLSTIKKILIKKKCHRLASIITYSLISMLITDIPYVIIRFYSIFGVRNHAYTSYFLLLKNLAVMMLETADVWTTCREITRKKRNITSV